QREGMEYEFDLLLSVDQSHHAVVHGSRCSDMDGKSATKPGAAFFAPYVEWLGRGDSLPPVVAQPAGAVAFSPAPAGQSNGTTHSTPALTPALAAAAPAKATQEQLAEMATLRSLLFTNRKVEGEAAAALWKQALADFNVTSAKELTAEQADEF